MTGRISRRHSLTSHIIAGLATTAFGVAPAPSAAATSRQVVVALCGHSGTLTIPLPADRSRRRECPSGGCHSVCLRRHGWSTEDADE